MYDTVIVGGGFYGAAIAASLARRPANGRIAVVEREAGLLQRASYNNQARVHNGYHYPRSFRTAFRSHVNFPHFIRDYSSAITSDFTKIYAIARRNSRVTARQFRRFCSEIGVELEVLPADMRSLFDRRLIEDAFLVKECAFDATVLAGLVRDELSALPVDILLNTSVQSISSNDGTLEIDCSGRTARTLRARRAFNCTYSGLNQFGGTTMPLKHELTEMALVKVPESLAKLGVTVMDGPFFSLMPFPARGLHTLSHVRYTPHQRLSEADCQRVSMQMASFKHTRQSRANRMVRDAARYMPSLGSVEHRDSLYEIKTVLLKTESDDARPILFESNETCPGLYSVLGGKIDNIYDCLEAINGNRYSSGHRPAFAICRQV